MLVLVLLTGFTADRASKYNKKFKLLSPGLGMGCPVMNVILALNLALLPFI